MPGYEGVQFFVPRHLLKEAVYGKMVCCHEKGRFPEDFIKVSYIPDCGKIDTKQRDCVRKRD